MPYVNQKRQLSYWRTYNANRREAQILYMASYAKQPHAIEAHKEADDRWKAKWPLRRMLRVARYRAKQAGLEFNITEMDLSPSTHCPVFPEIELKYTNHGRGDQAGASLDRKDNSKGYVRGNVVIMSLRANLLKNDGTAAEHRAIANWMEAAFGIG